MTVTVRSYRVDIARVGASTADTRKADAALSELYPILSIQNSLRTAMESREDLRGWKAVVTAIEMPDAPLTDYPIGTLVKVVRGPFTKLSGVIVNGGDSLAPYQRAVRLDINDEVIRIDVEALKETG